MFFPAAYIADSFSVIFKLDWYFTELFTSVSKCSVFMQKLKQKEVVMSCTLCLTLSYAIGYSCSSIEL